MELLLTVPKTQKKLKEQLKSKRLQQGFTQAGLAKRAGVSLPTLRKFEQKGLISLESFLKILMILDGLEDIVNSLKPRDEMFKSIDDILKAGHKKQRKYGWRT